MVMTRERSFTARNAIYRSTIAVRERRLSQGIGSVPPAKSMPPLFKGCGVGGGGSVGVCFVFIENEN
jgi:hypothetical protein